MNGLTSENAPPNAAEEHTLGLAFVRNLRHHMVERPATVPLQSQGTATLLHVQVYLFVCLSVCLFVCLSVGLFVYLFACLFVCSPLRSRRFLFLVVGSK